MVNQSINGMPTFYISPFDLINVKISGTIKVNDGDDDFIGFVFGYNAPLDSNYQNFDCLLFDWKKGQQGNALAGYSLSKINGTIPVSQTAYYFFDHNNDSIFEVWGSNWGSGKGWTNKYDHNFFLLLF